MTTSSRNASRSLITDIVIRMASQENGGLVAWASVTYDRAIRLESLAVRCGRDGMLFVTYPARETNRGRRYSYYHPVDESTRQAIQVAILSAVECGRRTDRDDE